MGRSFIALGVAVVVAGLALVLAGVIGGGDDADDFAGKKTTTSQPDDAGNPQTRPASSNTGHIAIINRDTIVRAKPAGKALLKIGTETTWKAKSWRNPRVLPVLAVQGQWLKVIATELPDNKTGWIDAADTQVLTNPYSIAVDLGRRTITVTKDGKTVRRFKAAVGEQGTATPTGDFAVTDRLSFRDAGSAYGCCALALSAHQHEFSSDWKGGDRVAIHATPAKASIGRAATHGCMRIDDDAARWMIKVIPLGTVVKISA
jgi:lipoprotein-anchoring transpeptidase ErfK/SrfK